MSSREIAELTGKEHFNVCRDIRAMLSALAEVDPSVLNHVRDEQDARGYTACFHLPKDLTITPVSGYSVVMRHQSRLATLHRDPLGRAGGLLRCPNSGGCPQF